MKRFCILILSLVLLCTGCNSYTTLPMDNPNNPVDAISTPLTDLFDDTVSESEYGTYAGYAWKEINNNVPFFSDEEKTCTDAFELYSDLDQLGRCQVAYANICIELMPTEERGEIGQVKPTGWHTVKYPGIIDGNYLYNRCHLIGYQLAGENANEKNLITGTRYLNVIGMLPFENEVASYVKSTDNHVLYRVTPIFTDDNLVADGVLMEAYSVEDSGAGVCFNVFCYNAQPGIGIDYQTGDSWEDDSVKSKENDSDPFYAIETESEQEELNQVSYVLNTSSMKFHTPDCSSVEKISSKNRKDVQISRTDLLSEGYAPCKICNP